MRRKRCHHCHQAKSCRFWRRRLHLFLHLDKSRPLDFRFLYHREQTKFHTRCHYFTSGRGTGLSMRCSRVSAQSTPSVESVFCESKTRYTLTQHSFGTSTRQQMHSESASSQQENHQLHNRRRGANPPCARALVRVRATLLCTKSSSLALHKLAAPATSIKVSLLPSYSSRSTATTLSCSSFHPREVGGPIRFTELRKLFHRSVNSSCSSSFTFNHWRHHVQKLSCPAPDLSVPQHSIVRSLLALMKS